MARVRSVAGGTLRTKAPLRATGRIERRGERFRLTLNLRDDEGGGERTVDSDSCADLAGAAGVTLGLLLENKRREEEAQTRSDSGATAPGDESPSSNETEKSPPPKTDAPPETAPDDGDGSDSERGFRILVQLPLATLDFGPLPEKSLGLGAGVGVEFDAFRVVAIGRYYATVTIVAPDYPAAGAEVDRLSAELWAGYGLRAGRFQLTPSLTGALQHYTARGVGRFVSPRAGHLLAFALGGGVMADVHVLQWLALTGSVAIRAETARPHLAIAEFGEVRRLGPAQASLSLGLTGFF